MRFLGYAMLLGTSSAFLRAAAVAGMVFGSGCRRSETGPRVDAWTSSERGTVDSDTGAAPHPKPARTEEPAHVDTVAKPINLLLQLSPASGASIAADDDAIYVATNPPSHRIEGLHNKQGPTMYALPSPEKVIEIPIVGAVAWTLTPSSIVFALKDSLLRVPKFGGAHSRLQRLSVRVSKLTSFGERLAWAEARSKNQSPIRLLEPTSPVRQIHDAQGEVLSLAMDASRVVFLEKLGNHWRLGSAPVSDGESSYTAEQEDPPPSDLVAADQVYFYRAARKELRRIASDLSKEEIIASNVDCELLAVGAQIYCGNEEGLFEIAKKPASDVVKIFTPEERMTALAVSSNRLAWIGDFAQDKLTVDMLPIVRQ